MTCILVGYILGRKEKTKKKILIIIGVIIGYLIMEYIVMGENSIVYRTLFEKLIGEAGKIDLSVDTGYYRVLAIKASWDIFLHYPFLGAGDLFSALQSNIIGNSANAGGGIIKFMCVEGLVSFIPVFYLYVVVAKKRIKRWIPLFVHIFLWINTGFAQAEIVYSCIIMFAFVDHTEVQNRIKIKAIDARGK